MKEPLENISEEDILNRVEQRTTELMKHVHGCGQCLLLAIQEVFGFEDPLLFRAASGLSGGIGGLHSTCGVLMGAVLALGLKYGRQISDIKGGEDQAIECERASFVPVAKLAKWFEKEFGSLVCSELRKNYAGVDLESTVPWQKQMADECGMGDRCRELGSKTAVKVAEFLLNDASSSTELLVKIKKSPIQVR